MALTILEVLENAAKLLLQRAQDAALGMTSWDWEDYRALQEFVEEVEEYLSQLSSCGWAEDCCPECGQTIPLCEEG